MASLPVPPKPFRRVVLAPLVGLVSAGVIVLTPVLLVLAVPIDLLFSGRRWRTVRVVAFGFVYCLYEVACLLAVFWMWLASGLGTRLSSEGWQGDHYRLMEWWLRGLRTTGTKLFRLQVEVETEAERQDGPILVFSRHGGAGNSLMLVATIMLEYQRHPRIIMLEKLQWEPLFDTMLHRIPNRFIKHGSANREAQIAAIGELASGLGDKDAFVLFPEGHDFSPRLRERAIAHLRKKGHDDSALKAEQMRNVLPPRIGGVTTAIEHAPGADVIFVAHTVFEDVGSLVDLWRRIPLDTSVAAHYWRIPAAEVPAGGDELVEWLFAWWARIDTWIGEKLGALQLTAEAPPEKEDPPPLG
ncbi:MAG TPA: 1-acyl-sn-glycerol-3-phosphate acyltransferase [Actinomycetota bacterium]|nr:1-acyl-sn-glycerol-3-phosphate acyltransferase [Actinomycetota bacterium]